MPAFGMIVGEAPGREEDKQGRPFVGKSGKLLESYLPSFGLQRRNIYITNIVKEWPRDSAGKTRKPTAGEVEEWMPILQQEIQNVAPAAILALGRTASDALLGVEVPAGSKVGNVYTAWHPAFVLRSNTADKRRAWYEQLSFWADAVAAAL